MKAMKAHRVNWRSGEAVKLLRLLIDKKIAPEVVARKLGASTPLYAIDQAYRLRRRLKLKPTHARA